MVASISLEHEMGMLFMVYTGMYIVAILVILSVMICFRTLWINILCFVSRLQVTVIQVNDIGYNRLEDFQHWI